MPTRQLGHRDQGSLRVLSKLACTLELPRASEPSRRLELIAIERRRAKPEAARLERRALASVWCFFAAILSVVIVLGIRKDHRLTIKVERGAEGRCWRLK